MLNRIFTLLLLLFLTGCGSGLCPLRTSGQCSFGSGFIGPIGILDTSFNGTGIVTTPILASNDLGAAIAIQTDGKILLGGISFNGANDDFALVRYHSNGSLDTTFNTTGIVTTAVLASTDTATGMALQTDGKILLAGYTNNGANYDFAVVRYHSNGSLDTTFNTTGIVTTAVLASNDSAYAMTLQTDGKILLAGASQAANNDFAVVRYHSNGSLDTTFNTTGIVTTPILASNDFANAIKVQSDGKILVAGNTWNGSQDIFGLARYHSNGSLDTTFNTTGILTTALPGFDSIPYAIATQPDGKILLAGYADTGSTYDFAVVRYHSNGSLDTTFNTTGILTTPILLGADFAYAMALQSDGRILLGGGAWNGPDTDFAIARYR